MLVVTGFCRAKGDEEAARAAVRDLCDQARNQDIQAYMWTEDKATGELIVVEVHEDDESLTRHLAETDLAGFDATMTLTRLVTFGDPPSEQLQASLRSLADYQHHPRVVEEG